MKKIFIIEDNIMHLDLIKDLLCADYEIISTTKGEGAFEIALKEQPDLILMDLNIPDIDGYTITKELKSHPKTKDIQVVAVSALVMSHEIKKAFDCGCDDFIAKPINVNSFKKNIDKYFAKNIEKLENQKFNILIVDDNPINIELLNEALISQGFNTSTCSNGFCALEKTKTQKFDLILLDIMMSEMTGFQVIEELKENPKTKEVPVIFLSALNETKNITHGLELGSYDYITKPFEIEHVMAKIVNILKIKKLQDKLQSEKNMLDKILRNSDDAILVLDENFNIQSCGHKFLKMFDLKYTQVINNNFYSLIDCDNPNLCKECHLVNTSPKEDFKDNCLIKNGQIIEVKGTPIKQKGEIEGYIYILRDITLEKEIEEQKETFIATLTHDLKTPIRAEKRMLELLAKGTFGDLKPEQKEIIDEILKSSNFMHNMLDTLLTKYKYENGKIHLAKDSCDIVEIIKECCSEYRFLLEEKKQNISYDFENSSQLISIDALEIKRAIANLISNAINFTQENGSIKIKTFIKDDNFHLSVIDNGKGISQDSIEYIFDKYISGSKKFRQVGTGLGLYISKKILELHNGNIKVESKENEGSSFTINLPLEKVLA